MLCACCLHHQGDESLIALMMEAGSSSETAVNVYQTTRRNNPEDSHLRTCRRENLKSHNGKVFKNHMAIAEGFIQS
jgi:hypothetical protein